MRALRAQARLTSWITALAILVASLAPALSHALSPPATAAWMEICASQGSMLVHAADDDSGHAPGSSQALEHCPYCSLHTPTLAFPPAPYLAHLPLRVGHEVPPAFLAAPRTPHVWRSAQPRAPPQLS
jgi:hypothetical protein